MNLFPFVCLIVSAGLNISSTLRILEGPQLNCSQQDLQCSVQINNCTDEGWVKRRPLTPNGPVWSPEQVGVMRGESGDLLPVITISWSAKANGGVFALRGTEVHILEGANNRSILCVRYIFHNNIENDLNPNYTPWTFSLDRVVVDPGHTYLVAVYNLPKPDIGDYRIDKTITIPGCEDQTIRRAKVCVENGSLWDPHMACVSVDEGDKLMVALGFDTGEFSEQYLVSIQSPVFQSQNVLKENRTSLNVTFELDILQLNTASQCIQISLEIQPFFIGCKNDCFHYKKSFNYCLNTHRRVLTIKAILGLVVLGGFLAFLLQKASHKDPTNNLSNVPKGKLEGTHDKERKKVLIIYSLDHPLYRDIVLKLCAFLMAKCGTEVVLDLLDWARLGVVGSVQWLDWQREQIDRSSDKILILCSRGVRAKWRAMCGGERVTLREDVCSPMGDMLTPALSLMVPHFVRSVSFQKYMLGYFEDVCSEDDVPSPFKVTVKYKLMRDFEEVFFRIRDQEKHEPGRVNHVEGVGVDEYFHCPSGRALRDAIEAFHAYQLENPNWFENELVKDSEGGVEEPSMKVHLMGETAENTIPQCVSPAGQDASFDVGSCIHLLHFKNSGTHDLQNFSGSTEIYQEEVHEGASHYQMAQSQNLQTSVDMTGHCFSTGLFCDTRVAEEGNTARVRCELWREEIMESDRPRSLLSNPPAVQHSS